jgi:hypothetical protein
MAAAVAVKKAYAAAGLDLPQILWERGPLELLAAWSKRRAAVGESIRDVLVDAVRRKAEHAIDRAMSLQVRMALAGVPGLSRAPEFCASIDEAIWRLSERALPRLRLRFSDFFPRRTRRLGFAASSFSPLSAHWLGLMECVNEVCGLVRQTQPLAGLWEIARHASWMVPHASVCWLMERPQLIRTDPNGRLHAPDSPALQYGDGCKVYAWKGIILPAHLIEQRDRIAYRVAEDDTGILWRQRWRWEAWAAVEVINGTPEPDGTYKRYFLQVPPTVRTPREGVAWTYGLSERHYRPAVRT